jgi:hypothetical protein
VSAEWFVEEFGLWLQTEATRLRAHGVSSNAQTCDYIRTELEARFRRWWLAQLTIGEAAKESGYSEERLREMTRDGSLPHQKSNGARGHTTVARCDLPKRPKPATTVSSLEERLLRPRLPLRAVG